ncbi:MAG: response regulator [Verrucomicrobiota bacterium]|nr:response regulator [Chthoniobacterales bacterium]MDQ3415292.1 response regulator [Verrucomicrobiota bacterium]
MAIARPQRILLVEDHADTAVILTRLLRRMGHDVLHASSIETALKIADREMRAAPITLVMSDLGLPDGSGLDLMRQLSSKHGLRGIALSGFGMDSDLAQSTAAGFSRHLVKPVDIATLRATIAEMTSGA